EDHVRSAAADENVAAVAAEQEVGLVVADEDVVGLAARNVRDVANAAGRPRGRAQGQVDADPDVVRRVVQRAAAVLAAARHRPAQTGRVPDPDVRVPELEGVVAAAAPEGDRGRGRRIQKGEGVTPAARVEGQALGGVVREKVDILLVNEIGDGFPDGGRGNRVITPEDTCSVVVHDNGVGARLAVDVHGDGPGEPDGGRRVQGHDVVAGAHVQNDLRGRALQIDGVVEGAGVEGHARREAEGTWQAV